VTASPVISPRVAAAAARSIVQKSQGRPSAAASRLRCRDSAQVLLAAAAESAYQHLSRGRGQRLEMRSIFLTSIPFLRRAAAR